jgi:nitroreductase
MEKPADAQYPLDDLIRRRWSPRAFSSRPVEPENLWSLFEAARWAPSCFNEQPWALVYATKDQPAEFDRLLQCLVPGNMAWAKQAPVLMLSVAKLNFDRNGSPNRHAYHDVGLAAENMVIQALSLGIFVHQMAGFDVEKARETLAIPASHDPVAMIALGYPGELSELAENLRQRETVPRTRKTLAQFVFDGNWGRVTDLVDQSSATPLPVHGR